MENKILKIYLLKINFYFIGVFLLLAFFVTSPGFTQAATGDVLAEDLHETSLSGPIRSRTVQTEGCAPSGTGECIKMDCIINSGDCSASDLWNVEITDSAEITISWWERFDAWPLEWFNSIGTGGGAKSTRAYNGPDSQDYMAAFISFHSDHGYGNGFYTSAWDSARVTLSEYVTGFNDYDCDPNSPVPPGVPFMCTTRLGFGWTLDGGVTQGMGTSWRKMREYIKMPTSYSSADGIIKFWVDDKLLVTLDNVDMQDHGGLNTTNITFAPIDTSGTPHGHWYDEISVYEGYVPPSGGDVFAPSAPAGLSVL